MKTITGVFKVVKDGEIMRFTDFSEVPSVFDNLVSFKPDFPEGPHTPEEHEMIEGLDKYFQELLRRQTM